VRSNDMNAATYDNNSAWFPRKLLRFRLRTLLVVAALFPMLIWLSVGTLWHPPQYRSWEDIRESYRWLEVVAEPDGPGPYLELGGVAAGRGAPLSGSFAWNGTRTKFDIPAHPNEAYRIVGLAPQDDSPPTFAVLRFRHVPAMTHDHRAGQTTVAK
jgi:hypothetical protein